MTRSPGTDLPPGNGPPRTGGKQDLWPNWTGESIPALFTHLYLFRLAAHLTLSPAELRSIADRVEQLAAGLQRVDDSHEKTSDDSILPPTR